MVRRIAWVVFLMLVLAIPNVMVSPVRAQTADFPPLIEPGSYGVRLKILTFDDKSRGDWKLETGIWYPADKTKGTPVTTGSLLLKDAPPDKTGAPYPLIVYSHGWMSSFGELMDVNVQLASQGYVVVAPTHHDTNPPTHEFVDRPLDIQFVLNELDAIKEGDLAGMIGMNNIGLMGDSQGAATSLQMLGILSDPKAYMTWCKQHPEIKTLDCRFLNMEPTETYRSQLGLSNLPDGRWTPFDDTRIRAVLVMAPCYFPLASKDMLASVRIPSMIMQGSKDEKCDYEGNAVDTYTHLGTKDRYLITVVGGSHDVFDAKELSQHFATAFFGYYLKGDKSYLPYLTPEHLPERLPSWSPFELVWGPYDGE